MAAGGRNGVAGALRAASCELRVAMRSYAKGGYLTIGKPVLPHLRVAVGVVVGLAPGQEYRRPPG